MEMNDRLSRRAFVRHLTVAGAAIAAIPLMTGRRAEASSMVPVGKAGEFSGSDYKKVSLPDGSSVYIMRDGEGFKVLSAKCTHKGCDVLWVPGSRQFRCPCHGGLFGSDGGNVSGPPPSPLASRSYKVDGGVLYVAG